MCCVIMRFRGCFVRFDGTLWFSTILAFSVIFAEAASAADMPNQQSLPIGAAPARPYDILVEIGAGGAMRPAYEGAKGYEFNPTGFFTLHYLWLPGVGNVKKERAEEGFSIGPSFRYVYKRNSDDNPELRGLNNVDAAFELGGRFAYQWRMFRPWLAVRYGIGGHGGIVAETGLDLRFRPSPVTEFTIRPPRKLRDRRIYADIFRCDAD